MKKLTHLYLTTLALLAAASLGAPTVSGADITTGLQGWWKLDDGSGTAAADSSDNGRNGALLKMKAEDWVTAGKIGGALKFSGGFVSIPYNEVWQLGNSTTIALWYQRGSSGNLLCHAKGGHPGWRIRNEGCFDIEKWLGYNKPGEGVGVQEFYFTPAAVGTWGHLAVVVDRGASPNKVYIYVDGKLASGYPKDLTVGANGQTGPLYFGARGDVGDQQYDGLLDDVRIYNRALSADDVAQLVRYDGKEKIVDGQGRISQKGILKENTQAAAGEPKATNEKPDRVVKNEGRKKKILLLMDAGATEFRTAFEGITQQAGLWTFDVNSDRSYSVPDLANYDVVLTYDCQPFPAEEFMKPTGGAALMDWISKGGALVAFHSAYFNREYCKYVGGERMGHPWGGGEPVPFVNNAPDHPLMKGIPREFQLAEEIFDWNLRDTRLFPENFHLLFSVDMSKAKPKVDHAVPVAGCAEHGQGRIYFNHWGHWAKTFTAPWFQKHLVEVIRWATKMDKCPPTKPNPEYTMFEDAKAFVAFHADKAGMPMAGFASFYAMTATTHPDLAKTYVETVAKLRKGEGSIPEFLKSLSK